ncbi:MULTISPECIES: electron transport complex subunit RsxB [Pseudomonas syringae group]|uniref:Ion-translocating oxidoreductase complex subunit B n=1 Tax=Pseudomonas syringae pv. coriandricola TaxID=264453 RepID=A0A0P9L244_9PSED|nr:MULTISPECIES: electron transport complex subunit RsxB [Pseudomonas syringae group]KPW70458.1 Iron-sulfur cluster-binding protein [Pseudomonas syringae pv. coriandricola]RMN13790.1 Iron-sulfur cluster-binding protein [Pseudomonas syringae pv. coriandricola]
MTDLIHLLPSVELVQRIDALLPQTQCGKCGHSGCRPYADGIAGGEAINKCPPGGDETIAQLADLLAVPRLALDTERGAAPAQVAFIREAECIGCTKCIQACPVDAIVGAAKLMHTVIIDECTGCDLCIAPCPVDCIEMHPLPLATVTPIVGGLAPTPELQQARLKKRTHARLRFESRNARLHREQQARVAERLARSKGAESIHDTVVGSTAKRVQATNAAPPEDALKKAKIALAMSRAQLNKSLKAFGHPPIAEQAARLVELQHEYEAAEQALEALLTASSTTDTQETFCS